MAQVKIAVTIAPENELLPATIEDLKRYQSDFDIIELRIDQWQQIETTTVRAVLQQLKDLALNKQILVTYRTANQGGLGTLASKEYLEYLTTLITQETFDVIDLEFDKKQNPEELTTVINLAQNNNKEVVLYYHDFDQTPQLDELKHLYYKMHLLAPDYLKVAVMPKGKEDVTNLLNAMSVTADSINERVVGIAMGKIGIVSRTAQGVFGGTISYGCIDTPKAPGQIHVATLRQQLDFYN